MWFQRAAELPERAELAQAARGVGARRGQRSRVGPVPVEPDSAVRGGVAAAQRGARASASSMPSMPIDQLQAIVNRFPPPAGGAGTRGTLLVRRGVLRGIPLDPAGTPFELDPATGRVVASRGARRLSPMPQHCRLRPHDRRDPRARRAGDSGLAVGSFLNVCIHRLPRGESIVQPGSRCPHCGYVLRLVDNIPVRQLPVLGGKCRKCRAADLDALPDRRARDDGDFILARGRSSAGHHPGAAARCLRAC